MAGLNRDEVLDLLRQSRAEQDARIDEIIGSANTLMGRVEQGMRDLALQSVILKKR